MGKLTHSNDTQTSVGFHIVRIKCAVDVVGKWSQAVISTSDDKCVTQLVSEITSLLASWPFDELAYQWVDLLPWKNTRYITDVPNIHFIFVYGWIATIRIFIICIKIHIFWIRILGNCTPPVFTKSQPEVTPCLLFLLWNCSKLLSALNNINCLTVNCTVMWRNGEACGSTVKWRKVMKLRLNYQVTSDN